VGDLEVVEVALGGEDVPEQGEQRREVPLAVAKFTDEAALRVLGHRLEGLVEGAVGGLDAQVAVEDEQGVADGVADVLGVGLDLLEQQFCPCHGSLSSR